MRNFIGHTVNHILKHCLEHEIGNLVVGDWEDMKRGLKMKKKTAQAFKQISYKKFKENLQSKYELYGIKVEFPDEKLTSQTCFNCGIIRKANRVKRGLYRCNKCGIERNADINGAINILKKEALEDEVKHIQWSNSDIISPKRVELINFTT